jgi:FMN phosphatase YigB (HAD superfamily)
MNKLKPTVLVFDLDGCVVDSSDRLRRYVDSQAWDEGDYTRYYNSFRIYGSSTEGDMPILKGIEILNENIAAYKPDRIVALTSRGEYGREHTLKWIRENIDPLFENRNLIMNDWLSRMNGVWAEEYGHFSHTQYKSEKIGELMAEYEVVLVIDDHPDICEAYRDLGLNTLELKFDDVDCITMQGGAEAKVAK